MICNECELPPNIELGQLMFSPNVIHIDNTGNEFIGRGTTINGLYTKDEIVKMYNMCLEEIRKMDGDEYEALC